MGFDWAATTGGTTVATEQAKIDLAVTGSGPAIDNEGSAAAPSRCFVKTTRRQTAAGSSAVTYVSKGYFMAVATTSPGLDAVTGCIPTGTANTAGYTITCICMTANKANNVICSGAAKTAGSAVAAALAVFATVFLN